MTDAKKKDETTDTTQEEKLQEQYEFGLNEDTRKEIEKKDDEHKESDNVADEEDVIVDKKE